MQGGYGNEAVLMDAMRKRFKKFLGSAGVDAMLAWQRAQRGALLMEQFPAARAGWRPCFRSGGVCYGWDGAWRAQKTCNAMRTRALLP